MFTKLLEFELQFKFKLQFSSSSGSIGSGAGDTSIPKEPFKVRTGLTIENAYLVGTEITDLSGFGAFQEGPLLFVEAIKEGWIENATIVRGKSADGSIPEHELPMWTIIGGRIR